MSPAPDRAAVLAENAAVFYRPEYERLRSGTRTFHIFWVRDRVGRRTHPLVLRTDPRQPAREVRAHPPGGAAARAPGGAPARRTAKASARRTAKEDGLPLRAIGRPIAKARVPRSAVTGRPIVRAATGRPTGAIGLPTARAAIDRRTEKAAI